MPSSARSAKCVANRSVRFAISIMRIALARGLTARKKRINTGILIIALSYLPAAPLYWEAPTERTDGTPLSSEEIKQYWLYRDDGEKTGWIESPTYVYEGHCYKMTTVDTDGRESDFSEEVCK